MTGSLHTPSRAHRGPENKWEEGRGRVPREASVSRVSDEEKRERQSVAGSQSGAGERGHCGAPSRPASAPPTYSPCPRAVVENFIPGSSCCSALGSSNTETEVSGTESKYLPSPNCIAHTSQHSPLSRPTCELV